MRPGSFKMLSTNYAFTNHIIYIKQDLALNNLQELTCQKTLPIFKYKIIVKLIAYKSYVMSRC